MSICGVAWQKGEKMRPKTSFFLIYTHIYPVFISKIGFISMQNQDHDHFRYVYFHYIISNTILMWNIRGPKNGPFLESILHLFVGPLHICNLVDYFITCYQSFILKFMGYFQWSWFVASIRFQSLIIIWEKMGLYRNFWNWD